MWFYDTKMVDMHVANVNLSFLIHAFYLLKNEVKKLKNI